MDHARGIRSSHTPSLLRPLGKIFTIWPFCETIFTSGPPAKLFPNLALLGAPEGLAPLEHRGAPGPLAPPATVAPPWFPCHPGNPRGAKGPGAPPLASGARVLGAPPENPSSG